MSVRALDARNSFPRVRWVPPGSRLHLAMRAISLVAGGPSALGNAGGRADERVKELVIAACADLVGTRGDLQEMLLDPVSYPIPSFINGIGSGRLLL